MLSKKILSKNLVKRGNEQGWTFEDIPEVIVDAKKNNMAVLGGQVHFEFDDGTYELYWHEIIINDKGHDESWDMFVERSCRQFMDEFNKKFLGKSFVNEALEAPFIRKKAKEGIDIRKHQIFVLYINDQEEYVKYLKYLAS